MDDQPGQRAEPEYSPDGRWWWDGMQWVAVEPDPVAPPAEPDPVAPAPVLRPVTRDRLGGRERDLLTANLAPGEEILGQYVGRHGQALVVTDRRVLIIKTGMLAGQAFGGRAFHFDYRTIASVEVRVGMVGGVFEVAGGGVQGTGRWVWADGDGGAARAPNCVPIVRRDLPRFQQAAALIRERIAEVNHPVRLPPPDRFEQLHRLATLRDQGILSPSEFEAQKARILEG
jgi:hypothetical protein